MPIADLSGEPVRGGLAPLCSPAATEKPDLVNRLVLDFLEMDPPRTFMPLRRQCLLRTARSSGLRDLKHKQKRLISRIGV
jgi:hypothetical protein